MNESAASKVDIAGTGISNVTLEETVALFAAWIRTGQKKRVCVTPVNCVVWASEDAALRDIYNTADLTLCDGVPLIWASKWVGRRKLRGRVTGLDLLPLFTRHCYQQSFSMFFMGSSPETLGKLCEQLRSQYPGIRIAGAYSPPYAKKFSDAENEKIISLINTVRPDIVWVSLTAPKQDVWIHECFDRLHTHIAIGIGGALDVMAGKVSRAPGWMQRSGLEWLHRFLKEPKRLFRRYFIEAPKIVPLLWRQSRQQEKDRT